MKNPTRRTVGAAASLAAAVSALSACAVSTGPTGPVDSPTTTTIAVESSFGGHVTGFCEVSTDITFVAEPVSVPAGAGKNTPISERTHPDRWMPQNGVCKIGHLFTGLQPGRWRVAVAGGVATGVCVADFQAGQYTVDLSGGNCSVKP